MVTIFRLLASTDHQHVFRYMDQWIHRLEMKASIDILVGVSFFLLRDGLIFQPTFKLMKEG